MGMDLIGSGGDFRFSRTAWFHVLNLAIAHGWEPAGTEAPKHDESDEADESEKPAPNPPEPPTDRPLTEEDAAFLCALIPKPPADLSDGGYTFNDYQRVTDEDAANLADALERALPDVPRHNAIEHKQVSLDTILGLAPGQLPLFAGLSLSGVPAGVETNPMEWFSGEDGRKKLTDFIAYCRQGGFLIG